MPRGRPLGWRRHARAAFQIRVMVERPTRCPTFFNAPWIRVWPQVGFSSAIRTVRRPNFRQHSTTARAPPSLAWRRFAGGLPSFECWPGLAVRRRSTDSMEVSTSLVGWRPWRRIAETLDEWSQAFEIAVSRDQCDASLAARRGDQRVIEERGLFVERLPALPCSDGRENPTARDESRAGGCKHPWRRSNGSNIPRCTARTASAVRAPAASSCITTALRYTNGSARFRKTKTSDCASSSRKPSMKMFVSSVYFTLSAGPRGRHRRHRFAERQ